MEHYESYKAKKLPKPTSRRYNIIQSIQQLVDLAIKQSNTPTLVVACAADEHVLEAVHKAATLDIVKPLLVGDETAIKQVMETLQIHTAYPIIHEPNDVEACKISVKLVHDHDDYFLMKGLVPTATILHEALNKEYGLRTNNRISHVSVIQAPNHHKLLFMSDGGMNIAPNLDDKRQILENAVLVAHSIGYQNPNVGIIAAIETVNPKMEATLDAEKLVQMNRNGIIKGCTVGGPFAIDNAVNKEAAIHKGITDPIAGDVDILIMPRIESGNVFYKALMFLANAQSASMIAGATKPIVLTSRADSAIVKFNSIAFGALAVNA